MNINKEMFLSENLDKNLEQLEKLMSPAFSYDTFSKLEKNVGFRNVLSEMRERLSEYKKMQPAKLKEANKAQMNIDTLWCYLTYWDCVWNAGKLKEEHNKALTRETIYLMTKVKALEKENQRLNNILNEEAA